MSNQFYLKVTLIQWKMPSETFLDLTVETELHQLWINGRCGENYVQMAFQAMKIGVKSINISLNDNINQRYHEQEPKWLFCVICTLKRSNGNGVII